MANRIWLIIVGAFSIVFVISSFALIAATFVGPFVEGGQVEDIQLLLTVVTTIAGVLAGFISGRASSSGSGRPGSNRSFSWDLLELPRRPRDERQTWYFEPVPLASRQIFTPASATSRFRPRYPGPFGV